MHEMTPEPAHNENETKPTQQLLPVNIEGAGLKAKTWLLNLLTDLYQRYGEQMWESPQLGAVMGLLNMPIPGLTSIRQAVLAFQKSGPRVLEDKLQLSDQDAVVLLNLFYDAVIDGYKEVLGVDLEAQ